MLLAGRGNTRTSGTGLRHPTRPPVGRNSPGGFSGVPHLRQWGHLRGWRHPGSLTDASGQGRRPPARPYTPWRPAHPHSPAKLAEEGGTPFPPYAASEGRRSQRMAGYPSTTPPPAQPGNILPGGPAAGPGGDRKRLSPRGPPGPSPPPPGPDPGIRPGGPGGARPAGSGGIPAARPSSYTAGHRSLPMPDRDSQTSPRDRPQIRRGTAPASFRPRLAGAPTSQRGTPCPGAPRRGRYTTPRRWDSNESLTAPVCRTIAFRAANPYQLRAPSITDRVTLGELVPHSSRLTTDSGIVTRGGRQEEPLRILGQEAPVQGPSRHEWEAQPARPETPLSLPTTTRWLSRGG